MSSRVSHLVPLVLVIALVVASAGAILWWWMSPKKPARPTSVACPPVRTTLAVTALLENPTAKTYAAFGPGAGAFTNIFAQAGLVPVMNQSGPVRADLVFVSGESTDGAVSRAKEWCATNGILAIHYDVRKTAFTAFQKELVTVPENWSWRLWFPGRSDCLVVARPGGTCRPHLADMMDLFAREGLFFSLAHAGVDSLPVLFASFAGSRETALPVFAFAQGEVVPECFVTKEIPALNWIDDTDVDADIREPMRAEIRSMQVVRRMVLQGDIHARDGKMDAAMDAWTKAIKRNPNDSLILERICLLDVNAETFLKVGNFPMAAQCLETMVCLRPKDIQTIRRLSRVLEQAGKKDLAEAVSKRADELMKIELKARKAGEWCAK